MNENDFDTGGGGGKRDTITIHPAQDKRFFADGKIEAYCGPQEVGAPDDLEGVIINFINDAQKTLRIAVQELDSMAIAQAIIDAKWRGVSVQMFLEQDYLLAARAGLKERLGADYDAEEDRLKRQWQEYANNAHAMNREIFAALLRNGIDVKADYNPSIFHQKFIIRDYTTSNKIPPPAVLTGSTNFTVTGTHKNLNHIVIFHDKSIAYQYNQEFNQIRRGVFGQGENTRNSTKPRTYNVGGVPVRILFSPDNIPELELVKQMLKATRRIDFAIFTFSGSSAIDDAMVMVNRAGVKIRGALEAKQANQKWSAREWLQRGGIDFYYPDEDDEVFEGKLGKLHHKLMVIDSDVVVGGSMNYTGPANDFNDENIFVIGSPYNLDAGEGGPVNHTHTARIANFFRTEINRIIEHSHRQNKD
ncbi:MAG: phospholipase D-like domain-containing protein [Phototrophicaceae bacterium]